MSWVRIAVDEDGVVQAAVAGLGHRRPLMRPVPLSTATALAASGVPTVIRTLSSRSSDGRLPLPSGN